MHASLDTTDQQSYNPLNHLPTMKLTPYKNPSSSLSRVTDFDDWFRNPFASFPAFSRLFDWEGFGSEALGRLATDIHEDKDNYYASFEVPGVKKDDVKIEL